MVSGHFDALSWVSTANVFFFSGSGCSRRRGRVRFPGKFTGFLADLRYFCRSPRAGGLAATRVDGHARSTAMLLRHVATNGDTARLETRATSLVAGRSATRYRLYCSRRGLVYWLAGRGGVGSKCLKKQGLVDILIIGYRKQGLGAEFGCSS